MSDSDAPDTSDVADFVAAELFDGDPDDPSGRLALLRWLADRGFTTDEMYESLCLDSIGSMAGDRRLVPGERMKRAAAAEQAGMDGDLFDAIAVALQFQPIHGAPTGEIGFTANEIGTITEFGALRAVFSPDEALSLVRTIGSAVARMAEASVTLFLADVESPHVLAGASELELAIKVEAAIGALDGFGEALDPILRRQMLQTIERTRRTTVGETERFQYRHAVGFIDLVGFTSVSAEMSAPELATFIRDFEARTHDLVTRHAGRVVKLIGDEVMFVAEDAGDACRVGSALMEGFAVGDGIVVPRGGLAFGSVLLRGGDFYGTIVNLAARLVDEAVPQELLVTEAVAEAATDCKFEPAGRRMVKGFAVPITVKSLVSVSAGDRP